MERMLVVVFDNEKKAYEGKSALGQLQAEGSLTIYQEAVILKHADGTVSVKQVDDSAPVGTLTGTALGGLIGLLGGPVGMALGAASGAGIGVLYDADTLRLGEDFVDDVAKSLAPNKVAVVAEVDEDVDDPGGHPDGSARWNRLAPCAVGGAGAGTPRGDRRDEGGPRRVQGRDLEGQRGAQGKAPEEDRSARGEDRSSSRRRRPTVVKPSRRARRRRGRSSRRTPRPPAGRSRSWRTHRSDAPHRIGEGCCLAALAVFRVRQSSRIDRPCRRTPQCQES